MFNKYNKVEQKILEHYSEMIDTMGIQQAKKMVKGMLDQAIEESKNEGMYNLPPMSGDALLKKEKTDKEASQMLEKRRREGVTDEDVRWWWNMNDIERRMMLKIDELHRTALFIEEMQNSTVTAEEGAADKASARVRKFHPMYGDSKDETHTKGDDRPLPFELKDRINIYIENRSKTDPEQYKEDLEQSTTFNALVRKEIKAGNI